MGYRASHRPIASPLRQPATLSTPCTDFSQFIRFPLSQCRRFRGDRAKRRESPRPSHSRRVSGCARGHRQRRSGPRSARGAHRRRLDPPVLGSKSRRDAALIARHRHLKRIILSLDFYRDAFQGQAEILSEPGLWPRQVIAMTLERVGSGASPISRGLPRSCRSPVSGKSMPAYATPSICPRSKPWAQQAP
jgi:hypothetical protein